MSIRLRLRLPFASCYLLAVLLRNVELILPETIYSSEHSKKKHWENGLQYKIIFTYLKSLKIITILAFLKQSSCFNKYKIIFIVQRWQTLAFWSAGRIFGSFLSRGSGSAKTVLPRVYFMAGANLRNNYIFHLHLKWFSAAFGVQGFKDPDSRLQRHPHARTSFAFAAAFVS